MNDNPYAAPRAEPSYADPALAPAGEPQAWDVGEVIVRGWELYKPNAALLSLTFLASALVGTIPSQVAPVLAHLDLVEEYSATYWAVHAPLVLVGWVVRELFAAGFTRACTSVARTGRATMNDVFGVGGRLLPFLALSFLKTTFVAMGLVMLVVPGVILGVGLWMSRFYVVDEKMGPFEAMHASWAASEGQKGNLFLFWLADVALSLLGLAACCLGVAVTEMVVLVARAVVYLRISGRARGTPSDAEPSAARATSAWTAPAQPS